MPFCSIISFIIHEVYILGTVKYVHEILLEMSSLTFVTHLMYTFDLVHFVLHPHRIAPTFLKLDSWSSGAGFIPIISTKGRNQIEKGNYKKRKFFFIHIKRFIIFFRIWVQFRVGAIPRLPFELTYKNVENSNCFLRCHNMNNIKAVITKK